MYCSIICTTGQGYVDLALHVYVPGPGDEILGFSAGETTGNMLNGLQDHDSVTPEIPISL